MNAVLVTGGAGYIGSHVAKALSLAGFKPVTVDNLERGYEIAVKWGPLEKVNLLNSNDLDDVFIRHSPIAVVHLAAYAYVGESMSRPFEYYRNNVFGSLNLFEAMARAKCDRIVFSSTCATYGVPKVMPISENTPQMPVNPYGQSKLMVERMLVDADVSYGLRHVCLRYFNAGGADPDGEIGEMHDPETHLIPLVLQAALRKNRPISIFGDDYDTPDGTCIRDYIHVSDLAAAHVLALRWLLDGKPSRNFNLGTGQGFSVAEVIKATEDVINLTVPFKIVERREGDPPVLVADASRAKKELGWSARRSDLRNQISDAWKWQRAWKRSVSKNSLD